MRCGISVCYDIGAVGTESRAWRALEGLARTLSNRSPRQVVSELRAELTDRAVRAGVRALDQIVSNLAGRPVQTQKLLPPEDEHTRSRSPSPSRSPNTVTAHEAPTVTAHEAPTVAPPQPPAPEIKSDPPAPQTIADQDLADRVKPTDATAPLPSLPERFGIDRVVLLAGHSEWVFAYWEIDPSRLTNITRAPTPRAELRLVEESGALVSRTSVDPLQGRQHLRIPELGKKYRAELISIDPESDGALISRSRLVMSSKSGDQVETQSFETLRPEPSV